MGALRSGAKKDVIAPVVSLSIILKKRKGRDAAASNEPSMSSHRSPSCFAFLFRQGSSYVPTKANLHHTPTSAPSQPARSIPPPQAARPSPPPQAQAQAPVKAADDDDTWGEEPPAVGPRPAFVASSPASKSAYVAVSSALSEFEEGEGGREAES